MFNSSVNVYNTTAFTSGAPTINGGSKSSSSGVIAATAGDSGYCLKKLDVSKDTGADSTWGAWSNSGHIPTDKDITMQMTVAISTGSGATFETGSKITLFYAFTNKNFLGTDNSTNRLLARKELAGSARLWNIPLPNVTTGSTTEERIYITDRITVRAPYVYVWMEHSNLSFTGGDGSLLVQVNFVS